MNTLHNESVPAFTEHDCPYVDRLATYKKLLGSRAIGSSYIENKLIPSLHLDGVCPPTHIDENPTTAWEEIIDHTRS